MSVRELFGDVDDFMLSFALQGRVSQAFRRQAIAFVCLALSFFAEASQSCSDRSL